MIHARSIPCFHLRVIGILLPFYCQHFARNAMKSVLCTTVSGDNYWKGTYDHANAVSQVQTYGCPDPYTTTEMEDLALAVVADRMGMLDRLLILRVSVDLDIYMNGATPEMLWGQGESLDLAPEESVESADIFETAMGNVGSVKSYAQN